MKPRDVLLPFQNIPIRSELGRQIRRGFFGTGLNRLVEVVDYRTIEQRMALFARKEK